MKLTTGTDLSDESLQLAAQMGVTHLKVNGGDFLDENQRGPLQREKLLTAKKKVEAYGLKIEVFLLPQPAGTQHWNIRLGLPGKEQEIEDVNRTLEILGEEDVPVVEYVFNLSAVFGSTRGDTARGGATVRHFDYDEALKAEPVPEWKATEEEVWDRITYFIKNVVPVAEGAGVRLACHPDDPPVPTLKGETRVLGSFEGLKRLLDIVPSDSNGLNFCQGTVAEMGVDVLETIRYFGSRDKINHVHFRNIKGAVPRFEESFIDDGDVNMLDALRVYKEVGYTRTLIPDHWPTCVGDSREVGHAHALGYMKGIMEALDVLDS